MKKYNSSIIISVIFLIKFFCALYLVHLTKCDTPELFQGIAQYSGDAPSYIVPIDNYIETGSYYYESVKAGRMPYLGIIYYIFRLIFSKTIALNFIVISQILLEAIAIYYLAILCKNIFSSKKAFWFSLILSCISLNVSTFNYYILSESFGISFLCLFVYAYYSFLTQNKTNRKLLIAGLFLALTVLFKPYLCLIFLILGIEFLISEPRINFKYYLKGLISKVIILSLPLIILNAPWTIRNYIVMNKFIPFQQDVYAGWKLPEVYFAAFEFVDAIGESYVSWDKRSAGCYFEPQNGIPCEFEFNNNIFSKKLTLEKIEEVRAIYIRCLKYPSDTLTPIVTSKFKELTNIYKEEHPFNYYFVNPFKIVGHFLLHSGSYYLPISKESACYQPYQFIIKLSQSLLYYLTLTLGFIGTIILLFKKPKSFIVFVIPIYLVVLFPLVLKRTEFRLFHPAYPFLMIGLVYIIMNLKRYQNSFGALFRKRKIVN
jgi:4-amino-4-deoxy-L-arabinose transferase-like glycosyltransferase